MSLDAVGRTHLQKIRWHKVARSTLNLVPNLGIEYIDGFLKTRTSDVPLVILGWVRPP